MSKSPQQSAQFSHRKGPQLPCPETPFTSLASMLIEATAEADPNRIAFVHFDDPDVPSITYGQFISHSKSLANYFEKNGIVRKGEVAALCLSNCYHYPASFMAIAGNGGVTTGFSDRYNSREAVHILSNSDSVLLVTTSAVYKRLSAALHQLDKLRTVILIDGTKNSLKSVSHRIINWEDIIRHSPPTFDFVANHAGISPKEDLLILPYSSGTTGLPKGVMLTHFNYVAQLIALKTHSETHVVPRLDELAPPPPKGSFVLFVPIYHVFGFFVLNANLLRGDTVVFIKRYTLENILKAIHTYRPRTFSMVPSIYAQLLAAPPELLKRYDISSVVNFGSGGSALNPEVTAKFQNRFRKAQLITNGYGMTEFTVASFSSTAKSTLGSIGVPLPNVEYRIVNPDTGKECGPNEEGEMWVRGPTRMKGYWKNEKATRETITPDGWLRTGDLVRENENREVFVVSRLKELIKVKGLQVSPAELEQILMSHPAVEDCGVVGIPDAASGELPRAYIVIHRGTKCTEREIYDHVAQRVSGYKRLEGGVEFVKHIPRNEPGKILRRQLVEDFVRRNAIRSKL